MLKLNSKLAKAAIKIRYEKAAEDESADVKALAEEQTRELDEVERKLSTEERRNLKAL